MAEETVWPVDEVTIVVGASLENGQVPWYVKPPPEMGVVPGVTLAGGSYTSYGDAMIMLGMRIVNVAEAAGYSADMLGWNGYKSQLERGLLASSWVDGLHAKSSYFGQMNDCLHTVPCSTEGMDAYIARLKDAVEMSITTGLKTIVSGLVPFDTIDLPKAMAPYGIDYTISAEDYDVLNQKHIAAFENMPGITYLPYKHYETIDGMHPTAKIALYRAREIQNAIRDNGV